MITNATEPLVGSYLAPSGDTTGVTDTARLQALINTAYTSGQPIMLGPGTYYVSQITINVDSLGLTSRLRGLVLKGSGRYQTIIVGTGVGPTVNVISNSGSGGIAHVLLQELQLYYTGSNATTSLQIWNALHFAAYGCIFYANSVAVSIQGSGCGTFTDCEFYLSGPALTPLAALWIGNGASTPNNNNGTLTSSGPLAFVGCQFGSTNGVPTIILDGKTTAQGAGSFGNVFTGCQYGSSGGTQVASITIDGWATTAEFFNCHGESNYNTTNTAADFVIGANSAPRLVAIRNHIAWGNGNGTNYQAYFADIAACQNLVVSGLQVSKLGATHGYDSGVIHLRAGYPAANNTFHAEGISIDNVTGPMYSDANNIVTAAYAGPYDVESSGRSQTWTGSGVPAAGLGSNGDYYLRSDTPGTANQRIYVKSAGAWAGIL